MVTQKNRLSIMIFLCGMITIAHHIVAAEKNPYKEVDPKSLLKYLPDTTQTSSNKDSQESPPISLVHDGKKCSKCAELTSPIVPHQCRCIRCNIRHCARMKCAPLNLQNTSYPSSNNVYIEPCSPLSDNDTTLADDVASFFDEH